MLKTSFALISLVIGLFSIIPYLRDIFMNKTHPHMYSWLIWSILQTMGVVIMIIGGAHYGALGLGAGALVIIFVFILSIPYGTKDITTFDTLCLIGALLTIPVWLVTKDAVVSIILISVIDAIGFLPTYRKSYVDPYSETLIMWVLNIIMYTASIGALEVYSVGTTLYLGTLIATNSVCVAIIVVRRRTIRRSHLRR